MYRQLAVAIILGALPACLNPDISDESPVTMQAEAEDGTGADDVIDDVVDDTGNDSFEGPASRDDAEADEDEADDEASSDAEDTSSDDAPDEDDRWRPRRNWQRR